MSRIPRALLLALLLCAASVAAHPLDMLRATAAADAKQTLGGPATILPMQAHGGLAIEAAPPPVQVAGPDGTRDFEFICPRPSGGTPANPSINPTEDSVVQGCPVRYRDTGYSLVNSAVAVDSLDPRRVAIASLHGGATPDGPRDDSRQGMTHTTFASHDGGLTWRDQVLPQGRKYTQSSLGADADIVFDAAGRAYVAYLFDNPTVGGGYSSGLQFYKVDGMDSGSFTESYADPAIHAGRQVGNDIRLVHLAYIPGAATTPSDDERGVGDLADPNATTRHDRVIAVWHERVDDPNTTALPAWIDAAWTGTDVSNAWTLLPNPQRIGPCEDGSNAVAWRGHAYVACTVADGYLARAGARIGDVDVWRIDLQTGNTSLAGHTGVRGGGRPFLSLLETPEGGILGVLAYTKIDEAGRLVRVQTRGSVGHMESFVAGAPMEPAWASLGSQLRSMGGGEEVPLLDADITAFEVIDGSGAVLVIYKEWHDAPQQPVPDAEEPGLSIGNQLLDYNKFLVAVDPCDELLAGYHVQLGSGVDAFNLEQYQASPRTFNSMQDGLLVHPTEAGFLAYFSIDDYGSMQFGALRGEAAAASGCAIAPLPPLALPVAGVPQGLAASNAASLAVGATVGATSLLMVGYLLTAKRTNAASHAARAKR